MRFFASLLGGKAHPRRGSTSPESRFAQPRLEQLEGRSVPALVASQVASLVTPPSTPQLDTAEVNALLQRAAAADGNDNAIVVVVDRGGRLLGARVEGNVDPAITGNKEQLTFAIDGALAEARTAAFFSSNQAPLTSRTIGNLSQSTITQREVDSNPNVADQNSPLYGPGFVAPIGLGGHFPPGVPFTPEVDLFGIEHTNRDTSVKDGVKLPSRFNVPLADVPIPADEQLQAPDSYGYLSGIDPTAQPRGIGTLPGGIPIYLGSQLVGGIGVFFPGTTGYASEENSVLSNDYDSSKPDLSLEAEYIAYAALGGVPGNAVGTLGGVALPAGISLAPAGANLASLQAGINLAGVTLNIFGPGGSQGPLNLTTFGKTLVQGKKNSGTNEPVDTKGDTLKAGVVVPAGWLVTPHAGVGISAAQVQQMIYQGIAQANQTASAIRLPAGSRTRMVLAVTDSTGAVLGLYRMPDAPIFSIDVAVAKARNVAYYDDPNQLQTVDEVPGLPKGTALTSRTFRYLADPRYPEGIDGSPPGPFSILNDPGINQGNGLNLGAPLPASDYQSVLGYDSFHPGTNFHAQTSPLNQNGVVFFPGSSAVYKNNGATIVGGLGVSGDGVNEDDVVTAAGIAGFQPAPQLQADQYSVRGVRLPYMNFDRNPEGGSPTLG